jgi:hypothetical protein
MDTKTSFFGFLPMPLFRMRLYLPFCLLLSPALAQGQVRSKKPDRAVYQPRVITPVQIAELQDSGQDEFAFSEFSRVKTVSRDDAGSSKNPIQLVDTELEDQALRAGIPPLSQLRPLPLDDIESAFPLGRQKQRDSGIQQVGNTEIKLIPPKPIQLTSPESSDHNHDISEPVVMESLSPLHDARYDGCDSCGSNDLWSCDSMGCDGIDCRSGRAWHALVADHFKTDRWFASAELMLMWRKGDRLPALVTTGPDTDISTAGRLDTTGTEILFGEQRTLNDLRAGGRFTLGAWLDNRECQGLVGRYWFAGRESTHYATNQNETPVIARPFLNLTPPSATQDNFVIAFPGARENGRISVSGSSDVMGADLSIHQFLYGKYGGTIDLVYGYQFMQLDEDLSISSGFTNLLSGSTTPVGAIVDVTDSFEAINEFHGAQIGFASRYREGCWSFNSLLKFGFGSLNRIAKRRGTTSTTVGIDTTTINEGLLVNNNNSGRYSDRTFGWIPELDLSLGYRISSNLDATFGYHLIAMTDAVQVSGTIDPDLAVNTDTTPPTDPLRPSPEMRFGTFYLQGIHFGLQYGY